MLNQLSDGVRARFPVVLTHKYACDQAVVTLLRARTLGNSPSPLKGSLQEVHSEEWLHKQLCYLQRLSAAPERTPDVPSACPRVPGGSSLPSVPESSMVLGSLCVRCLDQTPCPAGSSYFHPRLHPEDRLHEEGVQEAAGSYRQLLPVRPLMSGRRGERSYSQSSLPQRDWNLSSGWLMASWRGTRRLGNHRHVCSSQTGTAVHSEALPSSSNCSADGPVSSCA